MRHSDEESLSFCAVLTCYVLTMCCVIAASVATLQLLGSCVHMAVSGPTGYGEYDHKALSLSQSICPHSFFPGSYKGFLKESITTQLKMVLLSMA